MPGATVTVVADTIEPDRLSAKQLPGIFAIQRQAPIYVDVHHRVCAAILFFPR